MEVEINHNSLKKLIDVPFSIGDVVRVVDYGKRYAEQQWAYEHSNFQVHDRTFNPNNEILKTDYFVCNKLYFDMDWKIVDVGYIHGLRQTQLEELAVRIINRNKEEMLILHRASSKTFNIVRKAKKQIKRYVVNIN